MHTSRVLPIESKRTGGFLRFTLVGALCAFGWPGATLMAGPMQVGVSSPYPDLPQAYPPSQPLPPIAVPKLPVRDSSAVARTHNGDPRDMRLLLLSADGTEVGLFALELFLVQLGIPFDEPWLKYDPLPPLSDGGGHGYYQGIILATGNLGVCDPTCRSALTPAQWQALDDYAAAFGVRTLVYFGWPDAKYGLVWKATMNASTTPVNAAFTTAAANATVFSYLNRVNPVAIANATIYTTTTTATAGETTTPLLTVNGDPVAVLHTKPDNREYLATTFDNNPYLLHSMAFNYGLINWVTKGVFLGSRKIYLSPQIDDLLIADDLYDPSRAECKPTNPPQPQWWAPSTPCPSLRIAGSDLNSLVTWQNGLNSQTQTAAFKLTMAFNGVGTTTAGGAAATNDSLVNAVRNQRSRFFWVNHTYDHENLDCYGPTNPCVPATYAEALAEIDQNIAVATSLRLPLDATGFVTPDISGLNNPNFMQAAYDRSIRYLPGDTSKMTLYPVDTVVYSSVRPGMVIVPRRPTNVFYNTSIASGVVAGSETDEYNYLYGPGGLFPQLPTQTYAQLVARESDNYLTYMLQYSIYPLMYHQANLDIYSGSKSLLRDVIDATLTKYKTLCTLPITSLSMTDLGKELDSRTNYYYNSGVSGTLIPGVSITLTTQNAVTVPLTGACVGTPCATYGGQKVMKLQMNPNSTTTINPTF